MDVDRYDWELNACGRGDGHNHVGSGSCVPSEEVRVVYVTLLGNFCSMILSDRRDMLHHSKFLSMSSKLTAYLPNWLPIPAIALADSWRLNSNLADDRQDLAAHRAPKAQ